MASLRKIYYILSPSLRFVVRRLFYLPVDWYDKWTGRRGDLIPPKGLVYTGGGDFVKEGKKIRDLFIEIADLKPNAAVLDIGSGIGRIAIPLTEYLNKDGHYEGFDVVKLGVEWCQKNITTRFSNFRFQYIDLDNDLYRATGQNAANFEFLYPSTTFDFSVLNSVFTHMLPAEVENYLKEISRVLKNGGQCYVTFFLLNKHAEVFLKTDNDFDFPFDYGHYRLMDDQVKAANVAFQETWLQDVLKSTDLEIKNIYYGYWSGRVKEDCKDFQDIVLLQKRENN